MKKILLLLCALPLFAFANVPVWKIDVDKSQLTFIATQNGAPVTGQFKKFNGDIKFDKNNLKDSAVDITVDMSSLDTEYNDLTDTLKKDAWFALSQHPTATFKSNEITQKSDGQYQAAGTLTIKGKSVPVTLSFQVEDKGNNQVVFNGETELKRLNFSVGSGEWANTNQVKDEVQVKFSVAASQ